MRGSLNIAGKKKLLTHLGCEFERCPSVLCALSKLWMKSLAIKMHVERGAKIVVKESRKSVIKRLSALHKNYGK